MSILNFLVDGKWGQWEESCSKTCNSGQNVKTRKCNSPSPSLGGKLCVGSDSERSETTCNNQGCPGNRMSYFPQLIQDIFFHDQTFVKTHLSILNF